MYIEENVKVRNQDMAQSHIEYIPMQYAEIYKVEFFLPFSYCYSKHRMWVHVRTPAYLSFAI